MGVCMGGGVLFEKGEYEVYVCVPVQILVLPREPWANRKFDPMTVIFYKRQS